MKKLMFVMGLLLISVIAFAQKNSDGNKRERLQALKVAFITQELNLTTNESEKFWPIYNSYQDKIRKLRKDFRPEKKPAEMTDAEAEIMIKDYFVMEEQKLNLEKNMYSELKIIIGPKRLIELKKADEKFKMQVLKKAGNDRENRGR